MNEDFKSISKIIALVLAGVLISILIFNIAVVINTGEVGVKKTLGKFAHLRSYKNRLKC